MLRDPTMNSETPRPENVLEYFTTLFGSFSGASGASVVEANLSNFRRISFDNKLWNFLFSHLLASDPFEAQKRTTDKKDKKKKQIQDRVS